jgi:hypothetical protein
MLALEHYARGTAVYRVTDAGRAEFASEIPAESDQ